jgi:trehalose 6-phosphate phosphatase
MRAPDDAGMSPDALRDVADRLAECLFATDFDGTLAPIVDDPAAAVPIDGSTDLLGNLAAHVGEVVVISGRPLSYLTRFFPPSVTVVGLYGLEMLRGGERVDHPNAGVWRETMADVASGARLNGPDGMRVELKDVSITLHYRQHPEIAEDVAAFARSVAGPAGLRVRPARMSVELHPPIDEDKGTALTRLAADHQGPVVFIGDDVGDLAAFAALDPLEESGRAVLRVAVDSDELPDQLRAGADLVVDGPAGVVDLIGSLIP